MKKHIRALITDALYLLKKQGVIPESALPDVAIDRTRDPKHGDYA